MFVFGAHALFVYYQYQICIWEEEDMKKQKEMMKLELCFCVRFVLKILTLLDFVAILMKTILLKPKMGWVL